MRGNTLLRLVSGAAGTQDSWKGEFLAGISEHPRRFNGTF